MVDQSDNQETPSEERPESRFSRRKLMQAALTGVITGSAGAVAGKIGGGLTFSGLSEKEQGEEARKRTIEQAEAEQWKKANLPKTVEKSIDTYTEKRQDVKTEQKDARSSRGNKVALATGIPSAAAGAAATLYPRRTLRNIIHAAGVAADWTASAITKKDGVPPGRG